MLTESRTMARLAAESGDDGSNDLIVSGVIRRTAAPLNGTVEVGGPEHFYLDGVIQRDLTTHSVTVDADIGRVDVPLAHAVEGA